MQQPNVRRSLLSFLLAALMVVGAGGVLLAAPASQSDVPADEATGVLIVSVQENGPADAAGLVRGDIVLAVDGVAVNSVDELVDLLGAAEPGDEVELSVQHGSETLAISVTLGDRAGGAYLGVVPYVVDQAIADAVELPGDAEPAITPVPTEEPTEEPTAEPTEEAAEEPTEEAPATATPDAAPRPLTAVGAAIAEVLADSPAAAAGLQVGDIIIAVNDKVVENAADLAVLVRENAPGDEIRLTVRNAASDVDNVLTATLGENPQDVTLPFLGIRFTRPEALQADDGAESEAAPAATATPAPEEEPAATPTPMPEEESPAAGALSELEGDGALITEIVDFSPAALAGVEVGDVILAVDGVAVEATADLATLIRAYAPGDTVNLSVRNLNSDTVRELAATLAANPQDEALPFLGVRYGMLSTMMEPERATPVPTEEPEEEAEEAESADRMPAAMAGALVVEVVAGGPAEAAGVQAGDLIIAVDDVVVDGDADLADLIGQYAPGDEISITVTDMMGGDERTLAVTLGENPEVAGKALLGVQYTPFTGGMRMMPFSGERGMAVPMPQPDADMKEGDDECECDHDHERHHFHHHGEGMMDDEGMMPFFFGFDDVNPETMPESFEEFLDQLREQFGGEFNPEDFQFLPPEFFNPDQLQPDAERESL